MGDHQSFMAVRLLVALGLVLSAQVLAQAAAPPEVEIDLVVEPAPQKEMFIIFFQSSPCKAVAEQNHCTGSPRDIALCLAMSKTALPPPCKHELVKEGLIHGDIELLHLLTTNAEEHPTQPLRQVEQEVHSPPVHQAPAKSGHVHPIVEHLRQTCATEFQGGVCSFALANRVCPKKLLHCLVNHRNQLSKPCAMQTRAEIVHIAEQHQGHFPPSCHFFVWLLMMLATCMCFTCCIKGLYRCCCAPTTVNVTVEPVVAVDTATEEDSQLEMALMISAADAGVPPSKGVPIVTSHDQI